MKGVDVPDNVSQERVESVKQTFTFSLFIFFLISKENKAMLMKNSIIL